VLICRHRGAIELHVVQLMPPPLHHILLHQNPDCFRTFLVPALPIAGHLAWKTDRQTSVLVNFVAYLRLMVNKVDKNVYILFKVFKEHYSDKVVMMISVYQLER